MYRLGLLVLCLFAWASPEDVKVEREVMIPMRDGVRLATDIYRPTRNEAPVPEKLPVLLQRTPYNKEGGRLPEQARAFAAAGYVVAVQDCRGRYKSEGVFTKYTGEGQDGFDTVEWLARLPYVDGQVGMWGTSYSAHVQANAAKLKPPHLKTVVINMGGLYNGWDHKIRNPGAFELQQLTWAFGQLAAESPDPLVQQILKAENVRDWLSAMPFRKGLNPLSIAPNFEDYILEMMTHSDYDEYWKQLDTNWAEYYEQTADIPMIHISGWYDSYCGGTFKNYAGLSQIKKSPISLMIGPWIHGGNARSVAGDVEFGPEAAIADFSQGFHLRWFDHFLKKTANVVENEPRIRVFVMGTGDGHKDANGRLYHGGYWKTATEWPLPGTRFTDYYLHAGGKLSTLKPAQEGARSSYTFDPHDPVPTIGGAFSSTSPTFESGAYDQRERKDFYGSRPPYLPLKARRDVLVFQTDPLDADVEVVGPVSVRIYASSTAVDTDFTAKLIDVYPPSKDFPSGFEMNLTDGIIRARYRNSPAKQELMKPAIVYEFTIEPFPTANHFKKGHRIRLDISSSNFPRFDVNPNTGEPLGMNRRMQPADNSVYHDAAHPSHVTLPLVPVRTTASSGTRSN